jgi:hypothetical protein
LLGEGLLGLGHGELGKLARIGGLEFGVGRGRRGGTFLDVFLLDEGLHPLDFVLHLADGVRDGLLLRVRAGGGRHGESLSGWVA